MEDDIVEQLIERLPPSESFGESYNKLTKAFHDCDIDILRDFLKLGLNPNVTLFDGHSPLTLLISTSNSSRWQETANLLLEYGSCPNKRNPKGTPVLSSLVACGESDLVSLVLDKGADLEATGPSGETALLTAVHFKQVPCLKVLLKRGANPNVQSREGNSALMWAAGRSNGIGSPKCLAAVKALLEYGANPCIANAKGFTPLMAASLIRESETVRTLINGGAELEARENRGETALFKAVYSNCPEAVKNLVNAGANVNASCDFKRIPLMVASTYSVLDTLLHHGSDVSAADNEGLTALHHYSIANKVQFVRLLLIQGAKIDARDILGNTSLQLAIRARSHATIDLLVSKHANVCTTNDKNVSLFHELIVPCDFFKTIDIFPMVNTPSLLSEIQNYLLPSSAKVEERTKKLIELGGNCDVASAEGVTPLMLAALCQDITLCRLLLTDGSANALAVDCRGRNVVTYACRGGSLSVIKLLMSRDCFANNVDNDGNLPIFYSAQFSHMDIVNFLVLDLAFYMSNNV